MEDQKKAGRPPKAGGPLSDRQRAAQYRQRRHESASMAHEQLATASTAVLLAGLQRQFKLIETDKTGHADVARRIAGQLIKELCDRHAINVTVTE